MTYALTDLGNLSVSHNPNLTSFATGINNSGVVVGYSQTDEMVPLPDGTTTNNIHAFTYTGSGPMMDLGNILDNGDPNTKASEAFAINSLGQVVGSTGHMGEVMNHGRNLVEFQPVYAFVYDPSTGTVTHLSPYDSSYPHAIAAAINDAGVVVGRSEIGMSPFCPAGGADIGVNFRAVAWNPPYPRVIPIPPLSAQDPPGYENHALAVDPTGQVFGDSSAGGTLNACAPPLAYSWTPGSPSSVNLNSFFPGSTASRVYGVNASDQVVGFYGMKDPDQAFFLDTRQNPPGFVPLSPVSGDLNAVAYSINNLGQVVGSSGNYPPVGTFTPDNGTLWTVPSGLPQNLNMLQQSVWHVTTANGINYGGQIVGQATDQAVDPPLSHAVLLTPSGPFADNFTPKTSLILVDPMPGLGATSSVLETATYPDSSLVFLSRSPMPYALGGAEPVAIQRILLPSSDGTSAVLGTQQAEDGAFVAIAHGQPDWTPGLDGTLPAQELV